MLFFQRDIGIRGFFCAQEGGLSTDREGVSAVQGIERVIRGFGILRVCGLWVFRGIKGCLGFLQVRV